MLELPTGDVIILQPDGLGLWLTRKTRPRRKFSAASQRRRVAADVRLLEEREWIPALTKFFVQQSAAIAKRMNSRSRRLSRVYETRRSTLDIEKVKADATKQANAMMKEFFDESEFEDELVSLVRGLYEGVGETALASTGVSMGVDFDLKARNAVKKNITKRANQLAGNVSNTTHDTIARTLRDGIMQGKSIPQLAGDVQTKLQGASVNRATTIARTEVVSAYNGAVHDGATNLPKDVAAGMVWMSAEDERTRPAHADADGQIVEVGEPFIVDGEELQYPGDPDGSPENTINCRCATAILTPEEMEGRSVPMHSVSDVLLRMALYGITYTAALHEVRASCVVQSTT